MWWVLRSFTNANWYLTHSHYSPSLTRALVCICFFYLSINFNEIRKNPLFKKNFFPSLCLVCQTVSAVVQADLQATNKRCDYVILTSLEKQINKIKLSKPSWSGKQYCAYKARSCWLAVLYLAGSCCLHTLLDSELQLTPELVWSQEDVREKDTTGRELGKQ